MSQSWIPIPDIMEPDIYALTPQRLQAQGVRLLLLDIDNTLAPYTTDTAEPRLLAWVAEMQRAGLTLFLLSNNKGERPALFGQALGLPFCKRARKPSPRRAREVMASYGVSPAETALLGDQIYTDVLCAKRCGARAALVTPIAFSSIWLRLRYWLELPFRGAYLLKKQHIMGAKNDENKSN